MKRKSAKLVYSINGKMELVGKWGNKKAEGIVAVVLPKTQSLIYSSTGSVLATFTYSLIH